MARCRQGETCLHYAVRGNAKDLAIELLRYGADPKISGNQLQGTPLDVAYKTSQMVSLLSFGIS